MISNMKIMCWLHYIAFPVKYCVAFKIPLIAFRREKYVGLSGIYL